MPSLKAIRTRIASVKNTQKITRAMKLVSAARLRRAQDAIVAARPYAQRARPRSIAEVARCARAPTPHPLLDRARARERSLIVVHHVRPRPGRRVQRERHPRRRALHRRASSRRAVARGRAGDRRQEGPRATSAAASSTIDHELRRRRPRETALERRARAGAHRDRTTSSTARSTRVYLVYNEFKIGDARSRCVVEPLLPVDAAQTPRARPAPRRRASTSSTSRRKAGAARRARCRCTSRSQLYRGAARVDRVGVRRAHDRDGQRDQERQGDDLAASRCSTTAPARRRSPRS